MGHNMNLTAILCFLLSVLLSPVLSQQPISNKAEIVDGGTFTLTCDANRIALPANVNVITNLKLSKNTGAVEEVIAEFIPFVRPGGQSQITTIPQGRNWEVKYSPSNYSTTVSNRNLLKVEVLVNDAKCSDAGKYVCVIIYEKVGGGSKTELAEQNVTAKAGTANHMLRVDPNHSVANSQFSDYESGENLTFTCTVNGPEKLRLVWQRGSPDSFTTQVNFVDYPIANDITTSPASAITGSQCNQFRHQSILRFTALLLDDGYTYKCAARDGDTEVSSYNFTIGVKQTTPKPQGNVASAGADTDVGVIIGPIIGGLAAIIIVVLLIYFCWYRKRDKEDKYKDNEAHTDGNMHVPPPVVYSRDEKDGMPPKGMTNDALDTSYDSKGSDTITPSRYVNASVPESEGPPRYEKNHHRGHHNRGYDDDNREPNGDNRKRHHRDKRSHRSQEEEPKPRRYSTDDGTDERVFTGVGDPNMGTAI